MKHLLSLHIHGCFASLSSSDKWLEREVPAKVVKAALAVKGSRRFEDAYAALSRGNRRYFDEAKSAFILPDGTYFVKETAVYDGWTVYYTADTEHYHLGLHHSRGLMHHADLLGKVTHYQSLGFVAEPPAEYKAMKDAWDIAEHKADIAQRIAGGYVFPDTNILPTNTAQMQGGLSDAVFGEPDLAAYIRPLDSGNISCYGYIGNNNRRIALDRFLEAHMRDTLGWSLPDIAVWLTSTDGRHMADSYETPDDCIGWRFTNYAERERLTGKSQTAMLPAR